jgi:chromosome segregation ATPase
MEATMTKKMTRAEREARADLLYDLKSERESIDADIDGWKTEIEDALAQIAEAKANILAGRSRKAEIKAKLAELRGPK